MSCAAITMSTACRKAATSKLPSGSTNCIRFRLARLQALSSRCMYSEQGLDALMRPVFGQVCQSLERGARESVARAHGVVGVREEDRAVGGPVERGVVAGGDERPRLALLLRL